MRAHIVVCGPVQPEDVAALCNLGRALIEAGQIDGDLVCDVGAVTSPDAVALDAVARLLLTTRRSGRRLVLLQASTELRELLDLVGLGDLPSGDPAHPSGVAGSPNSGNSASVSRKNVNSTIRPSETPSTCSAHGS